MAEKKEKKFVTLQEIYDGYAKQAEKKEKPHEVDIIARHTVKFTSDFQLHKAGTTATVSTVMKDWYLANEVIEVVKTDKNKQEEKTEGAE